MSDGGMNKDLETEQCHITNEDDVWLVDELRRKLNTVRPASLFVERIW